MSGRTHVVWRLDHPVSEPVGKVAASKSATPISIEASATLMIQMKPSFDGLNMSITTPSRIWSRAFPIAPAMIKANPTVLRRTVVRRTTARTRMDAMQLARIREQPLSKNSWSTTCATRPLQRTVKLDYAVDRVEERRHRRGIKSNRLTVTKFGRRTALSALSLI